MACIVDSGAAGSGDPESAKAMNKKSSLIIGADGKEMDINAMQIPDNLKRILQELDMDNSGVVSEQNLNDSLEVLKELKGGLDTDHSGNVSHQEMIAGVQLLSRLTKGRSANASEMEYGHLPQCIQEVMKEWDTDGSGKVGAAELMAAAKAYRKIQQEGRLMRKIIIGLALVILFLMISMFVLSWAAVESAKEMRGSSDGVMATPSGTVVKVASSDMEIGEDGSLIIRGTGTVEATCPEGQTCRRLGMSGKGSLRVAQAEAPRQLSSTLPDKAFKELKSLTLKDNKNHSLKVNINSFQRLSLRSSRCGSVIHLFSEQGRLTIDDYEMTADEAMERYVSDAGMEDLFQGGPVSGFGRRLSSTDGMLEGFFNLLDDVEWECESVDLPSPDAMPQYYHAKVKVRHLHENPSKAFSYMFTDLDGMALELAGIEIGEDGRVYKTWEEDLVKAGSITAYRSQFEMLPFMTEVRLKRGPVQLRMETLGPIGYRCVVEGTENSTMSNLQQAEAPTMEFMGVVMEKGKVLRHWRMYPIKDEPDEDSEEAEDPAQEKMRAMVKAGMLPNVIDYFDVDTDPSGKFEPGQPFKVVMTSTVPDAKVYSEKLYTEIRALPMALEMEGVMDLFNISRIDTPCEPKQKFENDTLAIEMAEDSDFLEVTNRSRTDPTFKPPPQMQPWTEMPKTVKFMYKRMMRAYKHETSNPGLQRALKSQYWSKLMKYKHNKGSLEERLPRPSNATYNFTDDWEGDSDRRRLGSRWEGDEEGSYTGRFSSADIEASRVGRMKDEHQGGRRLSTNGRRLGAADWDFDYEVTHERIGIELEIGVAKFSAIVQFCHLLNPLITNWPACQTGRAGPGGVVKVESYASGSQEVWPFPSVKFSLGGLLVYDDTAALGCAMDKLVFLNGIGTRGKHLEDRSGTVGMHSDQGGWQQWTIVDATGYAVANLGTDMRVWIKSHRGKCLADHYGTVKLANTCQGWEKWRVLDGGNGMVYLQSHRGKYLGVSAIPPSKKTCTVRIYRNGDCTGSSQSYSTDNPDGKEWHFGDDNWESARAFGDCRLTEFFDEDEDESGYEDNAFALGNFECFQFPYDLDDDMSGLKIWAANPDYPEWSGSMQLYDSKVWEALWFISEADDGAPACSSGSPLLYGGVTIAKEMEIIEDVGISLTTELAAGSSNHPEHGAYIAEIYGKTILELTFFNIWVYLGFYPQDPWETHYKEWEVCAKFGYEIDFFIVFRDDWEIFCSELNL